MGRRKLTYSERRLRELKFDPMERLVDTHKRLLEQIKYYDEIRDGKRVVFRSDGKERNYPQAVHMDLYDKLAKVETELMKYGYAKVPDTINVNDDRPLGLVVNLTPKGEQYKINGGVDEELDDSDIE